MLKFFHLFKNYYFGISFIGIVAFLIQEIPYIIMPLINPASNPIMNMQNEIKWIETVQGNEASEMEFSEASAFFSVSEAPVTSVHKY